MTLVQWYKEYKKLSNIDLYLISEHIQKFKSKPLLSLLTPVYNTKAIWLRECIDSVLNQVYQNWELCLCDNASNPETSKILQEYANKDPRIKIVRVEVNQGGFGGTNAAISIAAGDYLGFLDSDDTLNPQALYLVAEKLNRHPDANWIYTDEAMIDASGNIFSPFFKPDYAPDLLLSEFYMSHLSVYKASLLNSLKLRESAGSHDYDLALRVIEQIPSSTIYHIPFLVYNYRQHGESVAANKESYCITGAIKSVQEHLDRIGRKATVYYDWPWYRVKYHLETYPHVDICIASINKDNILYTCIDTLLTKTQYPNYTINLCVTEPLKLLMIRRYGALVDGGKIKFVQREESIDFSYSILANGMNKACAGPILCILNDDIEPLVDNWLEEMVSLAVHPETGVVGAKLLYPNLTYQHVGCVVGIGTTAAHMFKGQPNGSVGYYGRAKLIGNFSMVTGACWVMRKELYDLVGGYDETIKVAYGDVDFCLKVMQAGYYNVYTPYASMIHKESYSRGLDTTKEKQQVLLFETEYLKKKWAGILDKDPFYNPNLSLESINFEPAPLEKSRYKKPWLV